jgi:hypothetical protein
MKYTIEITEKQKEVIVRALETYVRLMIGQIDIVVGDNFKELSWDDKKIIHETARKFIFKEYPPNGGPGIGHPDTDVKAKIAYEMGDILKNKLPLELSGEPFPVVNITSLKA